MAEKHEGAVTGVGNAINETVEGVANKVTETVEKAGDWVKEKVEAIPTRGETTMPTGPTIREHMEVVGSDGNRVGVVDRVEGASIKLTRSDSPDGLHHFIPLDWVASVDQQVHLNKDCAEARQEWQTA